MKKIILPCIIVGTLLWAVDPWQQTFDPMLWWYQNMVLVDTLNRIFAFNDTLWWVAGDNGIVYQCSRVDSVLSRTEHLIPAAANSRFTDIFFIDELHGWVVGTVTNEQRVPVVVCRTTDGGTSWIAFHLLVADSEGISYLKVRFANKYHGFILSNNGIVFKSADGGITWFRSLPPDRYR